MSDHNLAANRQLALAQIKADTRAERFDGKDAAFFRSWRKALEAEVRELNPTPENWLQMIDLRTTGEAKEMVRSVKEMAIENSQEALDLIWKFFESRYKSNPQAARKLLSKLQKISDISTKRTGRRTLDICSCLRTSNYVDVHPAATTVEWIELPSPATHSGGMLGAKP